MGVPADYHWSVCVPLPIARQKTAILFVCLPDTLFCYGVGAFSLPILVVSVQLCPFGWYVISAGHFPQKSPNRNLKIGFFPLPTVKPCPLTSDPCPVLAGYRLVRSRPCACFSSMYVQNLPTVHAFAVVSLRSLLSVFDYFLVPLSFMACPT